MFYVLTKRAVRMARDAGSDKFAARTTTHVEWSFSGPFSKRPVADRAACGALTTGTCLVAQVLTPAQIETLAGASDHDQPDYQLNKVLRNFRKLMLAPA